MNTHSHTLPPPVYVVPKLSYLNAIGLANGSIELEWRLEYDGGHPISNFEIHISVGSGRARRDTSNPDLVYHTDVNNNRLVTRAVSRGQTYSVMATASNILGASDPRYTNGKIRHEHQKAGAGAMVLLYSLC